MQVAMANYNEMAKADRDSTHAKLAEEEFKRSCKKYPKDPLAPKGEQELREVQEVLAEGQFRIAYYYFREGPTDGRRQEDWHRWWRAIPCTANRMKRCGMLGDVFEKGERKDVCRRLLRAAGEELSAFRRKRRWRKTN